MKMKISTVVVPAAGKGTRFYPYTKVVAKELLPIINYPAIEYIYHEIKASGITHLALITNAHKNALHDYLELCSAQSTLNGPLIFAIRQSEPRGLGDAILRAAPIIHDPFFAVCLPDDLIEASVPVLAQLIEMARLVQAPVIAVQKVPISAASAYGIITIKQQLSDDLFEIGQIVEKPQGSPPSPFAIVGRYILPKTIFSHLQELQNKSLGEVQLTDALQLLIESGQRVYAYQFTGTRYDIGTPAGWVAAIQAAHITGYTPQKFCSIASQKIKELS